MKILMLADSMGRGGTERRLTELLKVISGLPDFEVELVVFSDRIHFTELLDLNIKIHILKRKAKKDFSPAIKLFSLCKKFRPDIIHSWGSMATIFAIPAKIWYKPILINSIITDAPANMTIFDPRLARFKITSPFSDVILANSHAGLMAYSAPENRSFVIYNGFDFNRISKKDPSVEVRKRWDLKDHKVIGMVGAFEPRKDYDTFLQIANRILSQRSDVTFVAVGGGSMLQDLKIKVPTRFKKNIIFTGQTNNVEELIQIFDIGLLISNPKVHGEGISNAIMEYMAHKKPVIANPNGGNQEIIIHESTGYIIPESSVEDWVYKINWLIENPEQAVNMGTRGWKRILEVFHIDLMVKSFVDLYSQVNNSEKLQLNLEHQQI